MKYDLANHAEAPKTVVQENGEKHLNMTCEQSKLISGSNNTDVPTVLIKQIMCVIPGSQNPKEQETNINAALAMLADIGPKDGLEGMLAAQMVSIHHLSMECIRRAMIKDLHPDLINDNINCTTKLMRAFAAQMQALQKHRNGGKQTIKVQHVNVESGGQAIVGDVKGGGCG